MKKKGKIVIRPSMQIQNLFDYARFMQSPLLDMYNINNK